MGIKARRDDDEIRRKLSRNFIYGCFETPQMFSCRSCRTQRQIQREAQAASGSFFTTSSGTRVPWILMRRKEVNRRVVVEDTLRSVSVMNIPVNDRHSF